MMHVDDDADEKEEDVNEDGWHHFSLLACLGYSTS